MDVETENHRYWDICLMLRPRLIDTEKFLECRPRLIKTEKFLGCQGRDSSRLRNILDVETETEIYLRCRDGDSSRVRNFWDVETKTHRDWEIYWMSRPRPVETGQKMSIPRLHRDSR